MSKISDQALSRRSAFTAMGAGVFAATGLASSAEANVSNAANIKICQAALGCVAGTTCDTKTLANYLTDDCVLQLEENQPPVVGRSAGVAVFERFFTAAAHVVTTIEDVHAQGDLVFIHRTDEVTYKTSAPRRRFTLAGVFVVKDGKIHQWVDTVVNV